MTGDRDGGRLISGDEGLHKKQGFFCLVFFSGSPYAIVTAATEESTCQQPLDIHLGTFASGKHPLYSCGSRLYLEHWQQAFFACVLP